MICLGYRGKIGFGSISLIFKEENDSIFYKYIKQFEDIFDKYGQVLIDLEEQASSEEKVGDAIIEFKQALNNLIISLRSKELASLSADDTDASFVYKLLICGDGHVGKTSIALQFTQKAFKREYLTTIGVNISNKRVHLDNINQYVMLNIWDIAGQTKFTHFHQLYYAGASGFILVVDLTDRASFDSIHIWYKDIKKFNSKVPGLLVGNKKDLTEERAISSEKLSQLGQKLNLEVIEVSALTGKILMKCSLHSPKVYTCSQIKCRV